MDDLRTFRDMLRVDKHRLDDELELQADIMDRIAERMTALGSELRQAEEDMKIADAAAFLEAKNSGLSIEVAGRVARLGETRASAWHAYTKAKEEHDRWSNLLESWKGRGFSINKLCDLYAAQYFTVDSRRSTPYERPVIARHDYTVDRPPSRERRHA